jgi:hypothetical protein
MLRLRQVLFACACCGFFAACLPVAPLTRPDAGLPSTDGGVVALDGGAPSGDGGAALTDGGPLSSDGGASTSDGGRPAWCPPLPVPTDGGAPLDAGAPATLDGGGGEVTLGGPCSHDADCTSGYCTEGVCCESRCPGPCRSCRRPGAEGFCRALATFTDVGACDGYTCNGQGSCFTACHSNRTCSAIQNRYCELRCNACVDRIINEACQSDYSCLSGYCSNLEPGPDGVYSGVCCNERCAGPCETCRAFPGDPNEGICRPLPAETPAPACAPYTCDGQRSCRYSCVTDPECISGYGCQEGLCLPP